MSSLIQIEDFYKAFLDKSLFNLTKREKFKIVDNCFSDKKEDSKKGIYVDLELSSGGKRINNRIYSPKGQLDGIDSWTKPFKKAVIKNHDSKSEPIGRVQEVVYKDNSVEALKFFSNIRKFNHLKDSVDNIKDYKALYKSLIDNNLLLNKEWPGVSKLYARVSITDEDSVLKFLDERYLTFSSGATTNSMICSACGNDWALGDICEHRPGTVTEDGDLVLFFIGKYIGREISVVTHPANDTSYALNISVIDSKNLSEEDFLIEDNEFLNTNYTFSVSDFVEKVDDSEVLTTNKSEDMKIKNTELEDTDKTQEVDEVEEVEDSEETEKVEATETLFDLEKASLIFKSTLLALVLDNEEAFKEVSESKESFYRDSESQIEFFTRWDIRAVKEIIDSEKTSEENKKFFERLLSGAEASLKDSSKGDSCQGCDCKNLLRDYENLLKTVKDLTAEVDFLKEKLEDKKETKIEEPKVEDSEIEKIENPSVDSSDPAVEGASSSRQNIKLTDYENKVLERYNFLKNKYSQEDAEIYLSKKFSSGYLNSDSNIIKFMES